MNRQLPARNYKFGLVPGWGIFTECLACQEKATNYPLGMVVNAADLMAYAHMHERIYHPELQEPGHRPPVDELTLLLPVLPPRTGQGIMDHLIWGANNLRCADDACPCMNGALLIPNPCTVADFMAAVTSHRKDFPPATRHTEMEEAAQESRVGPFGVTPVEYAESRGRHPSNAGGYIASVQATQQETGGRVPFAESRASCIACRCPVEDHRGDLGCVNCACTHPTGVA